MARPKMEHPTPAELGVLQILWERGDSTVREVMEILEESHGRQRAYTSVMSLMNVMADKGQLRRRPQGRAFVYSANVKQEQTLGEMVGDLWQRAFDGSASTLVAHLLDETNPTEAELAEIRKAINSYARQQEDNA